MNDSGLNKLLKGIAVIKGVVNFHKMKRLCYENVSQLELVCYT